MRPPVNAHTSFSRVSAIHANAISFQANSSTSNLLRSWIYAAYEPSSSFEYLVSHRSGLFKSTEQLKEGYQRCLLADYRTVPHQAARLRDPALRANASMQTTAPEC